MLGDSSRATSFEEKAVRLAPQNPSYWNELARLYTLQGRAADAQKASEKAAALITRARP
jgi:Flp pilus assembly protein TadD